MSTEHRGWHFVSQGGASWDDICRKEALALIRQADEGARVAVWSDGMPLTTFLYSMSYGTSEFLSLQQADTALASLAWTDPHNVLPVTTRACDGEHAWRCLGERIRRIVVSAVVATEEMMGKIGICGKCRWVSLGQIVSRNEMFEKYQGTAKVSAFASTIPVTVVACERENDVCVSLDFDHQDMLSVAREVLTRLRWASDENAGGGDSPMHGCGSQ